MTEKFEKKETYEFCGIRNVMVRLEVIQATAMMPDLVHAEAKLMPVACNRAPDCKLERIRCIVYDSAGLDPCPELWKGES
ncbi:MAG: hypothetical protein M1133_04990 [Armatimonadetes bacterium]|nr:hypothetical protein [Armatimonadota bacterium]